MNKVVTSLISTSTVCHKFFWKCIFFKINTVVSTELIIRFIFICIFFNNFIMLIESMNLWHTVEVQNEGQQTIEEDTTPPTPEVPSEPGEPTPPTPEVPSEPETPFFNRLLTFILTAYFWKCIFFKINTVVSTELIIRFIFICTTPEVPSEPETPTPPTPEVPSEPETPTPPTPEVPSEPETPTPPTPEVPAEPGKPVPPAKEEPKKPSKPVEQGILLHLFQVVQIS
jgi:hypothetical protein